MEPDKWLLGLTADEVNQIWAWFEVNQNSDYEVFLDIQRHNRRRSGTNCSSCRTLGARINVGLNMRNSTFSIGTYCERCVQELQKTFPHGLFKRPSLDFTAFSAHLYDLGSRRKRLDEAKQESIQEKAEPYIKAGLAEPFARALVESQQPEEILNLWEATWWRQYEPTDLLVTSVLDETLTEKEARTINEFRGEHPELAMACIKQQITTEWAQMLLESGFEEHPDAVKNVLEGADPMLIARIRGMDVNNVPPPLGLRILQETINSKSNHVKANMRDL